MPDIKFSSSLSEYLYLFVEQKQAAGFLYVSNIGKLRMFDEMVSEKYPDARTVTKEIFKSWADLRSIYPRTILNDVNVIRQFSKYLNSIGIEAYIVPDKTFKIPPRYEPHIFTDEEKIDFFRAVDHCTWNKCSPTKCYVAPMIFRLLYCCGLRASEAVMLSRADVDLETGRVVIRASKRWRERIIYVSRDLLANLKEYDTLISELIPNRVAFFPNRKGMFFAASILDKWFHDFWDSLPAASRIIGNTPRVHDWRHTFFTDRLNSWTCEGADINALSMYLSEYGGHSHYAADDYYQHLTTSFYPEMEKRMSQSNRNILPEVYDVEG